MLDFPEKNQKTTNLLRMKMVNEYKIFIEKLWNHKLKYANT